MSHKTSIRVIKHNQRQVAGNSSTESVAPRSSAIGRSARDAADNVAMWVREFRERRPVDPRKAFANLFVEPSTLNPLT